MGVRQLEFKFRLGDHGPVNLHILVFLSEKKKNVILKKWRVGENLGGVGLAIHFYIQLKKHDP